MLELHEYDGPDRPCAGESRMDANRTHRQRAATGESGGRYGTDAALRHEYANDG